MKSKPSHNQSDNLYELAIADLLQIPEDRFDDFLIDLKKWHGAVRATLGLLDAVAAATGETEKPNELSKMRRLYPQAKYGWDRCEP